MDTLGYIYKKPVMTKTGQWNNLDLPYASSDEFNEATGKIMNILYSNNGTSDGRCFVMDGKGNRYLLDIIHATFDTFNNVIRVFPYDCRFINPEIKEKNDRKPNNQRASK